MYELMLDTANLEDLKEGLDSWPVVGVTSNPTILKEEGGIDVYARLREIKALCGKKRSLHVQVVSTATDAILEEARHILDQLGKDTFIKVPVSAAGLPAIKKLSAGGVNVTATAIYSTMQGMLAVLAGAKYIAVYFNRMENNCTDPTRVIAEIRAFIDGSGSGAKILAASFKNAAQVVSAYASGAQGATVGADNIRLGLGMTSIDSAVDGFRKDFEAIHGAGKTMSTI